MSPDNNPFVVTLCDGKYTVTNNNGVIKAERYREPWRDLTGDGLVLALVQEIERLTFELANSEKLDGVSAKHPTVKKWRYDAILTAAGIARRYGRAFEETEGDRGALVKACTRIADDIEGMIPPKER